MNKHETSGMKSIKKKNKKNKNERNKVLNDAGNPGHPLAAPGPRGVVRLESVDPRFDGWCGQVPHSLTKVRGEGCHWTCLQSESVWGQVPAPSAWEG